MRFCGFNTITLSERVQPETQAVSVSVFILKFAKFWYFPDIITGKC